MRYIPTMEYSGTKIIKYRHMLPYAGPSKCAKWEKKKKKSDPKNPILYEDEVKCLEELDVQKVD